MIKKTEIKRKIIVTTLAFVMLVSFFWNIQQVNAATGIINNGDFNIWHGSEGGVRPIGDFTVDGEQAFCIEHEKIGPPTGSSFFKEVYGNSTMRKILYYGYDGPAQWSGFGIKQEAIAATSLMLSEIYANEPHKYDYYPPIQNFKKFLATAPEVPEDRLEFKEGNLTSYYDLTTKKQRTPLTKVNGSVGSKVVLSLPNNVTIVNVTKGTVSEGTATLTAGDSYYYEAAIGATESNYATGNIGKNWNWQPVIFRFSGGWQTLGRLDKIIDPNILSAQNIRWLDVGSLNIKKTNNNGILIDGAEFSLTSTSYEGWTENYTVVEGELLIENLPVGIYQLTEITSPTDFVLDSASVEVEITKDTLTEKNIINKQMAFEKVDYYGNLIEGVKFEVTDNETQEIVDSGVTNKEAPVWLNNLVLDKEYTITETGTPLNYVTAKPVVFTVTEEMETQTVTLVDKQVKFIKENPFGIALKGGKFEVREKKQGEIEEVIKKEEIGLEKPIEPLFSFTADKNGIVIPFLEEGKTYIIEEIEAPSGYQIGEPIEFTVTEDKEMQIVKMQNKFSIGKIDLSDISGLHGLIMTGDNAIIIFAIFALLASAGSLFFIISRKKKRRIS